MTNTAAHTVAGTTDSVTDLDETRKKLDDLVIEADAGARNPVNPLIAKGLLGVALLWSLFQLWIASPLPFALGIGVLDDTQSRAIHLAFAVMLSFLAYPAFKSSPRRHIPLIDIIMSAVGAFCAAYLFLFYDALSSRSGNPSEMDIYVACVGMVLLLEATRRALGPPLVIIATIFLLYAFFGNWEYLPEVLRHKGQSLNKTASHQWLTTEGVYGVALGVSTSFVFLFVLFGALLDKAGAGNYFIKVAFSLLGHLRGGPAKAAVLSSGLTGLISGSSIANTVTTGTFTIPLMKRVGFSGAKSGAVEVASSVNGQIMPPVMGAAAFLMTDYVGIAYNEVVKHAFIPAIISYIALLYMVHLEALKGGMQALEKPIKRTFKQSLLLSGIVVVSFILFSIACYYVLNFLKQALGDSAPYIIGVGLFVVYFFLLKFSCTVPELEEDDPSSDVVSLPETGPTVKAGLHFLLPIALLVWCLMIERLSPGLSAFWATAFMIFILVTQRPLKTFFRKQEEYKRACKAGFDELLDGLVSGARNMIGIGVATAAAGIIVGAVSLTGIGPKLTEVVEIVAGGSLLGILLLTALICLILGMGLPTTANYIVVATLMAPVVQTLGAQNGLIVPLIAVHLFVFYFGIMADVTPPVGLASFAAASISGADPIRTGVQAFAYSLRTAILPFFFIFNTELILVGVDGFFDALIVFFYSGLAILLFSAAAQGYFLVRNTLLENLMLLLVSFSLFIPQFWINQIYPAYEASGSSDAVKILDSLEPGDQIRIHAKGLNEQDQEVTIATYIAVPDEGKSGKEILSRFGLTEDPFAPKSDNTIYEVAYESRAFQTGIEFEFEFVGVDVPAEQPHAKLVFIPALLLLGFIIMQQSVRRRSEIALSAIKE